MPKVNQEELDVQIQEIIIKQFLYAITRLESPKQTAAFLADFLTDAETIMFSKRLAIAILIIRGHSQTTITKLLSVSYSATGAVKSWLKNADPSTLVILNAIAQSDDWKELVYNFRLVNKGKKSKRGRKTITIHPETASEIDKSTDLTQPQVSKTEETPDFEASEGPELILDEPEPKVTNEPSMEELLES